jgi:hypothetical protein
MAATHKNQGAGLRATTALGREDLAQLAQEAASQAGNINVFGKPGTVVRVEQATADRLNFSIAAPSFRREFMTFALRVAPGTGGNGCQVQVSITSFKTKQTKALGFIPAGKKRLLGYGQYQTFMNQFAAGVRAKDPSARVDITDGISRVL